MTISNIVPNTNSQWWGLHTITPKNKSVHNAVIQLDLNMTICAFLEPAGYRVAGSHGQVHQGVSSSYQNVKICLNPANSNCTHSSIAMIWIQHKYVNPCPVIIHKSGVWVSWGWWTVQTKLWSEERTEYVIIIAALNIFLNLPFSIKTTSNWYKLWYAATFYNHLP